MLDHVRTSNFMALVGASGSGKSSVLRAGLLHQLKLGRRIAGSNQWRIRITRPDRHPKKNLSLAFVDEGLSDLDRAEALGRASGILNEGSVGLQRLVQASSAPRVILVIDQFEEVFTRCESVEEREQFFACLMGALEETSDTLCLIIAMRADFVGKCLERHYSGLAQQIQQHMISVLPMEAKELKAAICKPAEQVGLAIESALATEVLNDIAGAPGSLPLLQYTLKALWQKRQGNQLVLAAYHTLGGIAGALDKRATEIYKSFESAEQQTVQHIFQQLTQFGEGTEDTRRRVFQTDLISEPKHPAARVQQVIDRLSNPENRLLVTSEVVSKADESARMAIVDVAHEALIRHWRLLRQWIEQNRDLLRQQRKIEASVVSWREQRQQSGYLLQGLPLIEAKQFEKHQAATFPLSDPAKAFIKKSIRQRRWNRIKTASWLIIPALIVVGVVEHNIREFGVRDNYNRLDREGGYEEKQAVVDLVRGCAAQQGVEWLSSYLAERLFGNCRPLKRAPLNGADLRSADLSSADLSRANLIWTNLSRANLSRADLSRADLSNADLSNADLSRADLSNADLSNADLSRADLSRADLSNANLSRADLSSAYLRSAYLRSAYLSSADLRSADLRSADLSRANLSYAYLRSAYLSSAYLSSANLSSANLSSADLRSASLRSADLSNADLSNANIISANLSTANLISANLRKVIFLNTDLRTARGLTQAQLEGDDPPLICNTPLTEGLESYGDRDCEKLAHVLWKRRLYGVASIEEAQEFVNKERQRVWE